MRQGVRTVAETADLITAGRRVLLAGDESALRGLPRGTWIGGTIPYFMTSEGGLRVRDKIFVTELPDDIIEAEPRVYDARELRDVYRDAKPSGFSLIILPGGSAVHEAFAVQAPTYPGFGTRPLVGWVAGVHLESNEREAEGLLRRRRGAALRPGGGDAHECPRREGGPRRDPEHLPVR